jgi:two-component system sensor histidine kinase MprB
MSLRVRMALAAGVAVAIAVVAVSIAAYAGTSTEVRGQLDRSLHSLTGRIIGVGGAGPGAQGGEHGGAGGAGAPPEHLTDPDEGLHLDADNGPAFGGAAGAVTLVHPDGVVFHPPAQLGTVPAGARAKALAASGHGQYFENLTVNGIPIRVLATGIGSRGALLVALPMRDIDHTLDRLLVLLALIASGGILFAAALGLLVARTALRPISRFTRQTESIAANPDRLDSERIDVHGGDELARLAQTFNRTLDALERSVQSQRNLVADASHELRTPIATVRANLQLMRDEELLSAADREALRRDVIEERCVAREDARAWNAPARELAEIVVDVEGDVERRAQPRKVARQDAAERGQRGGDAGSAQHERLQQRLRCKGDAVGRHRRAEPVERPGPAEQEHVDDER